MTKVVIVKDWVNDEGFLVLGDTVLPIKPDERFIPPDLDRALDYYPNFIRYTKMDWDPPKFFNVLIKAVSKYCGNGYKDKPGKIMDEWIFYWRGSERVNQFIKEQDEI